MASETTRQLTWKALFIAALAVGSVVSLAVRGLNQGLDLKGGTELLFSVSARGAGAQDADLTRQTIEVVRRRADPTGKGVLGLDIRQVGRDRFMIRLPQLSLQEAERIEERIQKAGRLLFCLVNTDPEHIAAASEGKPVAGCSPFVLETLLNPKADPAKARWRRTTYRRVQELGIAPEHWMGATAGGRALAVLVNNRPEITGDRLDAASIHSTIHKGGRALGFSFKPEGRRQFQSITGRNKGRFLAIILDEVLYSAPVIETEISGPGVITSPGGFEREELNDLMNTLRAGSLPADIELESKRSVGPELGSDSIRAGFKAAIVGGVLVLLVMAGYYLLLGLIANLALVLNLLFILGALSALDARLSLPGIAGLILTLGMAVDANVLILERVREERARGKTLRLAVKNGYERAFTTIFDANVTTLITAVILFFIGTGPIQGFATVLSIGIISSVFCALFVTRAITELLLEANLLHGLTMLDLVKRPHLPFTRARRIAAVGSLAVIAIGLAAFYQRGEKKYDTDLIGGFMAEMEFRRPLTIDQVRARVAKAGYPDAEIQHLWGTREDQGERSTYSIRVKRPEEAKCLEKVARDLKDALRAAGLGEDVTMVAPWTYRLRLSRPTAELDLRQALERAAYRMSDIRELLPEGVRARDYRLVFDADPSSMVAVVRAVLAALEHLVAFDEATFSAGTLVPPGGENPEWSVTLRFDRSVDVTALRDKIARDVSQASPEDEDLRVFGTGGDEGAQRCLNVVVLTRHHATLKALLAQPDRRLSVPAVVQGREGMLEIGMNAPLAEPEVRAALSKARLGARLLAVIPKEAPAETYVAQMGTEEDGRIRLRESKVVEMIKADLEAEFRDDLYRKALAVRFEPVETPPAEVVDNPEDLKAQGYAFLKMAIADPDRQDAPHPMPLDAILENLRVAGYEGSLLLSEAQRGAVGQAQASEVYLRYVPGEDAETARAEFERRVAAAFDEPRPFRRTESVGERVSGEMREAAFWAVVLAMVAIVFYIWFRFGELKFGVAAIVALAHDVFVALGAVAVADALSDTSFGRALGFSDIKINLSMIGAFLTIVGYSLNDTIVIFDRIRENMGGRRRQIDAHLIDASVNETLSRTLMTSLTTLVVVAALYAIGGSVIHGFAFALLVGVVVGTYSSIFIASPILLDWQRLVGAARAAFDLLTLRSLRSTSKRTA